MKRENLYYEIMVQRGNGFKKAILSFFLGICSWPRLLLEVFIRKSFGERYFSFSTAIILAFVLSIIPYAIEYSGSLYGGPGIWHLFKHYFTWYSFLAAFLYLCWQRRKEVMREPGVWDFAKYSLYNGKIDNAFWNLKFGKTETTRRVISTIYEPAAFFIAGSVLTLFGQIIGIVIIICSVCYALSYAGSYYLGDHFIMDKIDEMICSEELADSFINNKEPEESRGFEFVGRKPNNQGFRKEFVNSFFREKEASDVR